MRNLGRTCVLLVSYRGFNIEPFCSDVCGDHRRPQTLAEICRNIDICCGFRAVAAKEKYPELILSSANTWFEFIAPINSNQVLSKRCREGIDKGVHSWFIF